MTVPGKPLTKIRSEWVPIESPLPGSGAFRRQVGDGILFAIVAEEPDGWHLSISFRDHRDRLSRYPRWDEIVDARYGLLPDGLTMAMLLPSSDEYVALHDTTFHLHEIGVTR